MAEPVTDSATEWVSVMGMRVPLPLKERIVTAVRAKYRALTTGLDDDAAVRAVTKYWFVSTLVDHEATQAEAPVGEAVEATRVEYAERAKQARRKALFDAAAITELPMDPPIPTDPQPGGRT